VDGAASDGGGQVVDVPDERAGDALLGFLLGAAGAGFEEWILVFE
jgi:hypothetical protein